MLKIIEMKKWNSVAVLVIAVFALALMVVSADAASKKEAAKSPEAAMLADKHGAKGLSCAMCHEDGKPKNEMDAQKCAVCHGNMKAMIAKTRQLKPNPHDAWHLGSGDIRCTLCHKGHKPAELYCNSCHAPYNPMDPKPVK